MNNMRAGALDKVVYEAAATCMPVLASNPRLRRAVLPAGAPLSRATTRRAGGAAPRRSRRRRRAGALGRELRARVEARHSVEHWADEVLARAVAVTLIVLHVQKVAGISGSEAHLLSLLPDLRARGWDIRFLMLHENEAGRLGFARSSRRGACRSTRSRCRADVDPVTFARFFAYLMRHRPTILHTHLVHADATATPAGTLARVPVRLSTKHGFNEFREGRLFALGDRTIGALAHRQIAISRGLARYLAETEGFPESRLRDRPLRHRRRRRSRRRTPAGRRASSASAA